MGGSCGLGAPGLFDEGEGFGGVAGDLNEGAVGGADEAFGDAVVKEGEETVVITVEVDEDAGLGVDAELCPGDDLDELVHGAVAAGEGDEGVGAVGEHGLALMHGADDVELGEAAVVDLALADDVGDDADDLAAGFEGGVGDDAHGADRGASVDEAVAGDGEEAAEIAGGIAVDGGDAVGGGAEDTDPVFVGGHSF